MKVTITDVNEALELRIEVLRDRRLKALLETKEALELGYAHIPNTLREIYEEAEIMSINKIQCLLHRTGKYDFNKAVKRYLDEKVVEL